MNLVGSCEMVTIFEWRVENMGSSHWQQKLDNTYKIRIIAKTNNNKVIDLTFRSKTIWNFKSVNNI